MADDDPERMPGRHWGPTANHGRGMQTAVFGVALLAAVTLAACRQDGSVRTFATVEIVNVNSADITIYGCQICGHAVVAAGTASGVSSVGTNWVVYKPGSLTYVVQIKGGGKVTCRPARPVSTALAAPMVYHLAYRVTADGRCVMTRLTINRSVSY